MSAKKKSATARRPGAAARPTQSPPIVRAMVIDALRSWVIPTLSGLAAAGCWVLSLSGVLAEAHAVVGIGAGLLVLALFGAFRGYFFAEAGHQRNASLALALAWGAVLLVAFYRQNFPGPPIQSGVLRPNGDPLALPPLGRYALYVDGHFTATPGQGSRTGQYALEITPDGGAPQVIRGNFEDRWAQQRLGRRGTAPVEIQRTALHHEVALDAAAPSRLRLVEIDPTLAPEVSVAVYPGTNPWVFPVLGVLGILGTLSLEKTWDGDGSATMAVSVTYFVVDSFLRYALPHQPIKSLIGAILWGGIMGAPLSVLLWRFVPRRWIARHS